METYGSRKSLRLLGKFFGGSSDCRGFGGGRGVAGGGGGAIRVRAFITFSGSFRRRFAFGDTDGLVDSSTGVIPENCV